MNRLRREIESFHGRWKGAPLWEGGYYEGDPLDPMGSSAYGPAGYVSVLHATYLRCIRPYVGAGTVALELGPGRGAWTRALLPAREVWCLDALSAEHNHFWEYVGRHAHVRYLQVADFSCSECRTRTSTTSSRSAASATFRSRASPRTLQPAREAAAWRGVLRDDRRL